MVEHKSYRTDSDLLDQSTKQQLKQPLDEKHVKQRTGPGGRPLSYIEAYVAIEQANRIFGEGNWHYEVTRGPDLHRIDTVQPETGEITKIEQYYTAHVAVFLHGEKRFEDVGFNTVNQPKSGEQPNAELHETAYKGSVSDGVKRALRGFGAQFGLSLYGGDSPSGGAASGPACPKHGQGSHVRPSKRGDGFYCARKDTSTESGFCDYKPREEAETPVTRETASYAGGGGYGADGYPGADDDWPSDDRVSGPTREQLLKEYISLGAKHNAPREQLYKSFQRKYGRSLDDATYQELTQLVEQGRKVRTN